MTATPQVPAHPPMPPIHVDRDGGWEWEGRPMVHSGILLYLKQHLERDPDGKYWVTVDSGRVPVEVEDAPYVVEALLDGPPRMRLDDDREEPLHAPLRLLTTADHRLYAQVHGGRDRALLSRRAHQQVWNALDEDDQGQLWLSLGAHRLPVAIEPFQGESRSSRARIRQL